MVDPAVAVYALLDALFARASVGLALLDRAGRFVRVNDTLARLGRRPAREHLGRTISEVLGDTGQELDALVAGALRTGEPVLDLEVAVAGGAGEPARTWSASWFPVHDPQLGPVGLAFVAVDITGVRQAERERAQAQARYRAVAEAGGGDVFHATAQGGLDVDLPAWRSVTGQHPGDLAGTGWLAGVHPDDRENVARLWHATLDRGGVFEAEFRLSGPPATGPSEAGAAHGAPRVVVARVLPVVVGEGRPVEWIGVLRDLSAQRAAESGQIEARQQVEGAVRQAEAAQSRAEAAQSRADVAETRTAAAEQRAEVAEAGADAAQEASRTALAQAAAGQQRLEAAVRRAEEAEAQVAAALEEAGSAAEQVSSADLRVSEAQSLAEAADQRAQAAVGQAEAAVGEAQAADRRAEQLAEQAAAAESRATAAEREAAQHAEQAAAATQRAQNAEEAVAATQARSDQAEREAVAAGDWLEAGGRFALALAGAGTVDDVVTAILDAGGDAVQAGRRGVALVDADHDQLRFLRPSDRGSRDWSWPDVALGAVHPVAEVVRGSRGLYLADRDELLARWPVADLADAVAATGEQAWALLPLTTADGTPFGVVTFGFPAPRAFTLIEQVYLDGVAAAAARAIERAGTHDRLAGDAVEGRAALSVADTEREARLVAAGRLDLLARATAVVNAPGDARAALRSFARLLVAEVADVCAIHLVTQAADRASVDGSSLDGTPPAPAVASAGPDDLAGRADIPPEVSAATGATEADADADPAGIGAGDGEPDGAVDPDSDVDPDGGEAQLAVGAEQAESGGSGMAGATGRSGTEPVPGLTTLIVAVGSAGTRVPGSDGRGSGAGRSPAADQVARTAWAAALVAPPDPIAAVAEGAGGRIIVHAADGWEPPADTARWLRQIDADTTAVLPVPGPDGIAAVITLTRTAEQTPYTDSDLTFLAELSARAGVALGRIERDRAAVDGAVQLRETLRGTRPGAPVGLQVAARYLSAGGEGRAGGEWSDVVDLGAGRIALVIGEARGQDVAATATMGQLRATARACARLDLPPGEVLALLHTVVADAPGEQSATCLYAIAEVDTGVLTLASAGHPPPLVVAPDGLVSRLYMAVGAPLGAARAAAGVAGEPTEYTVRLGQGYLLALFTDGLVRAGGRDADAGVSDLAAVLASIGDGAGAPLDALVDAACAGLGRDGEPAPDDPGVALLFARLPADPLAGPTLLDVTVDGPDGLRAVRAQSRLALENANLSTALVDVIVLVQSELTSNAVRHGRPPLSVRLRLLGTRAVVEVADSGGRLPRRRLAAVDDEAGRGLDLVSRLAVRQGTRPIAAGKVVWAEIDLVDPPTH
ncbi:SpoIIE family protein phosphatase [Frankia sp. AiPa1]|uniref:SpoIIE family protein phosphatase n=1 Tax=Frankia sp. AiPa1 TaxID=573492 RepID=UPI00202B863F|nr:SpoIIE family protein phosphatase [Frankia sp. AiPa1]MCL9758490.1 SpoIIE family protein phosphatase [Frankia sp. AiPa1]